MLKSWITLLFSCYVSLSSGDVFAEIDCKEFYGVYFFERQNPLSVPTVFKIEITDTKFQFDPPPASYDSSMPVEFKRLSSHFIVDELGCTATAQFKLNATDYSSCDYQAKVSVSLLSNGRHAFRIVYPTVYRETDSTKPCGSVEPSAEARYLADKVVH
jgi:hypothetical protein